MSMFVRPFHEECHMLRIEWLRSTVEVEKKKLSNLNELHQLQLAQEKELHAVKLETLQIQRDKAKAERRRVQGLPFDI